VEEVKKILGLTIAIVLIIGVVAGGTWAYFSDTEESLGNTFTAGTIDISVNGENPWEGTGYFTIADMKPCDVEYIDFTINNIGENEVDVWKHFEITGTSGGAMTEPECIAENGTWDSVNQQCQNNVPSDDIASVIDYDLVVDGVVIIDITADVQITDIECCWIYLGRIEPGEDMVVTQSYHMQGTAGNEYQGDTMDFTIELFAQQTRGCPPDPDPVCAGYGKPFLDYVNIGSSSSMSDHNAWGWFPYSTGNYGGGDPVGTYNFAMIGGDDDGSGTCDMNENDATFEMNACATTANNLVIRHLDGTAIDSFDVYVDGVLVWSYTGGTIPGEVWVTSTVPLGAQAFTGKATIRLVITGNYPWSGCLTYGQGAVNWAYITN
jgi:predicted ribosomally synthesized peptide with SipW-like signal peptide